MMAKIVRGNWIPKKLKKTKKVTFLAEKPSLHFPRNENLRKLGNFNVTNSDYCFQAYISKYIGKQIFITDMVKTEGSAGHDFTSDWQKDNKHKRRLKNELLMLNPQVVVCLSRKVEQLFTKEFPEYDTFYLHHPAHVWRYKKFEIWNREFKKLRALVNL